MLQYGLDALHIAYRIEPNARLRPSLDSLLPENRLTASYEVRGVRFELKRAGKRFALSNADCTIMIGRDKAGFNMVFEARAMLLRRKVLGEIFNLAFELIELIAVAQVLEARLRRVDIFMDIEGACFDPEDMKNFVSRARKQAEFHVPEKVYHSKDEGEVRATGFWFSPGNPIQVRLYDKLEELEVVSGKDSSKTRTELLTYRTAGWDGASRVWRLEAQLRGEVLKRLEVVRPESLLKRLWHLWDYCFSSGTSWLRLVLPDSSTRRERSELDPRWEVFTRNPFQETCEAVKPEPGNLGGTSPEQLMGNVWSMLSARGLLRDIDPKTPRDEMLHIDLLEAEMVLISCLKKSDRELLKDRSAVVAKFATLDDAEYFKSNFEDWPEGEE